MNITKEKNIFTAELNGHAGIDEAIKELAAFHNAEKIVYRKNINLI